MALGVTVYPGAIDTNVELLDAENRVRTTLTSSISDSVTTIPVANGAIFPTTGGQIVVDNEYINYTGVTSNDLTGCTRGVEGSSAAAHNSGATVILAVAAIYHNALKDGIIAVETELGILPKGTYATVVARLNNLLDKTAGGTITGNIAISKANGSVVDAATIEKAADADRAWTKYLQGTANWRVGLEAGPYSLSWYYGVSATAASPGTLNMALSTGGQLQLPITGANGGVKIGGDAILTRSAANTFKIENVLHIFGTAGGSTALFTRISGDTNDRLAATIDGTLSWGPGNAATDTSLYRYSAGNLETDSLVRILRSSSAVSSLATYVAGDVNFRCILTANGNLVWGDGALAGDTNLYRYAADKLKTDDSFIVVANLGINTNDFGASMAGGIAHKNGTNPTGDVADCYQLYAADQAAGNSCPHIRTENGNIIKLYRLATYTPSNVTPDRSFDADTVAVDELADVVGTLIADLQAAGFLG